MIFVSQDRPSNNKDNVVSEIQISKGVLLRPHLADVVLQPDHVRQDDLHAEKEPCPHQEGRHSQHQEDQESQGGEWKSDLHFGQTFCTFICDSSIIQSGESGCEKGYVKYFWEFHRPLSYTAAPVQPKQAREKQLPKPFSQFDAPDCKVDNPILIALVTPRLEGNCLRLTYRPTLSLCSTLR